MQCSNLKPLVVLLERLPKSRLDILLNKKQQFKESATEEALAAPDSTTSMFVEGEDVLVDRNHTGQFFMGTIVQIDRATEKCLLRFLDNKECWAHLNELQRVKDDPEEILCVVCKKIDQNVVRCPKCGRGYHRKCLELSIPNGVPASKWLCLRCGSKSLKKKKGRLSLSTIHANAVPSQLLLPVVSDTKASSSESVCLSESDSNSVPPQLLLTPSTSKDFPIPPVKKLTVRKFPYSQHSLIWDEFHRENNMQQYCYCGKAGYWYMQMLQCATCRQWFHQECLSCLHFPLYCGDQMYLFLCSVCNDEEFLRRFDFGWVDIVHLCMFNLILFKKKEYFDVDSEIIPYVKNNWFYLQIPAQLVKCSDTELRRIILKMLEDNSTSNCRFELRKDITTNKRIWGLKARVPPRRTPFSLPPVRPLTEDALRSWWKKCHITFRQPLETKYLMRNDIVLQPEGNMSPFDYGLMLGGAPSMKTTLRNLREVAIGIHLIDNSILDSKFSSAVVVNGGQPCGPSTESFVGYAKKSSAVCASNRLTLQLNKQVRNRRISPRSKVFGRKGLSVVEQSMDIQENSSQDGYDSLDSQASVSQDENYVSSNAISPDEESLDENDISQDGYVSSEEESDNSGAEESAFSPEDGSPEAPLSPGDSRSVYSQDEDDLQADKSLIKVDVKEEINQEQAIGQIPFEIKQDSNFLMNQEHSIQIAESVSVVHTEPKPENMDDCQSRTSPVTDLILPSVFSTPADTEADDDSIGPSESQTPILPTIADLIGAPVILEKRPTTLLPSLPRLTPVIKEPPPARAVKRKLSEKDIKIVNGQVKRRRPLRRFQSNLTIGTKTVHLDSGEKLEKRIVGGKLLRSPHKPPVPEVTPEVIVSQVESSTSSATPFVRQEEMSLSDVKKNINYIFNARNRISAGEKFAIKGRRVTADGVEYLIQWDYSI